MTEQKMGSDFGWFSATVDSRDDPLTSGRLRIRVHGIHDNTTSVQSNDLFWAHQLMPPTSASVNQIGQTPVGITSNSTVFGFWADKDKTIPVVMGSMFRANTGQQSNTQSGSGGNNQPFNDLPWNGRAIKDFNNIANSSIPQLAQMNSLFYSLKSIGSFNFSTGFGNQILGGINSGPQMMIQDLINKVDSGNMAGAIQGGPNIAKAALMMGDSVGSLTSGLGQVMQLIESMFTKSMAQVQSQPLTQNTNTIPSSNTANNTNVANVYTMFLGNNVVSN